MSEGGIRLSAVLHLLYAGYIAAEIHADTEVPEALGCVPWDARPDPVKLTGVARVAQSVERQTLNLVVAGSSPASGFLSGFIFCGLFRLC